GGDESPSPRGVHFLLPGVSDRQGVLKHNEFPMPPYDRNLRTVSVCSAPSPRAGHSGGLSAGAAVSSGKSAAPGIYRGCKSALDRKDEPLLVSEGGAGRF